MLKDIIQGDEAQAVAAKTRGWITGYYMPTGIANTEVVEVKLWRYDKKIDYGKKKFLGTELIVIYEGKLRFEIEDKTGNKTSINLNGERTEYLVLPPGLTKTVFVEEFPAHGITVRWPSTPENGDVQ